MLINYFPILVFAAMVLLMGTFLVALGLILGKIMGHARPDKEKQSPYECGFDAFEDARMKFDVRYYLVAILFIIFDLEIAFLFPWAVALEEIGKRFGCKVYLNLFVKVKNKWRDDQRSLRDLGYLNDSNKDR